MTPSPSSSATPSSRPSSALAFALGAALPRPCASRRACRPRAPARPRTAPVMTLQPQDSSWREERDRRAIESEFLIPARVGAEVDIDMPVLRERIQMLGRKEKQWADVIHQFTSMSILTGVPFIHPETGEPTAKAWVFLSLSAVVPLYVMCLAAQWLHSTSVSFSHLL